MFDGGSGMRGHSRICRRPGQRWGLRGYAGVGAVWLELASGEGIDIIEPRDCVTTLGNGDGDDESCTGMNKPWIGGWTR